MKREQEWKNAREQGARTPPNRASQLWKITFFDLVTLTFDLWPWPFNSSEILSRSMSVKNFEAICQTVQPWERWITDRHTDRQTYWTDFLPSTAEAGGNKQLQCMNTFQCFLGHFTPIAIPTSNKKILFTFTQISRLVLGVGKILSLNILSPVKTWRAKKSVEEWKSDHLLPWYIQNVKNHSSIGSRV